MGQASRWHREFIVAAAATFSSALFATAGEDVFNSRFFFNNGSPSASSSVYAYSAEDNRDVANTALALGSNAVRQYLLPSLGADAPEWAKRIEFEWNVQKDFKPSYSILTVQPLYQDKDKQNTIFVQASQLRYDQIDKYRDTTNIGLGYRRLLFDNQVLVGINSFFDYEWTYGHERGSVGGELKWAMLDFNANIYRRLSDEKMIDAATSTIERAMSGYDVELRSQMPFLPWVRIGARYYRWQSDFADDIKGWRYSADADITQNLSIEAGWTNDNVDSNSAYAKVVFRLARTDRPVMLSDKVVSKDIFDKRDMRNYTLDKVRRENKILVERSGGGIVVARGN